MTDADGVGSDPHQSTFQQQSSQNDSQPQGKPSTTNPPFPLAMSGDDGLAKRPRDSRLLHMILANLGVTAYQERVPLQLMDFAYRYTSSTLQDALHLTSEGYGNQTSGNVKTAASNNDMSAVTLSSLRLSIASRTHYQFSPTLSKDFYHDIAQERNQVQLPPVGKDWGVRLPPEQYCLTGVGWKLKDEWASVTKTEEGEEGGLDQIMMDREEDNEEDGAEDGNERMEDIFGETMENNGDNQEMEDG
ncbi:MAG: hypothetical protein LQ338_003599 [Usnochroma carphineum]|nr:MAG: hypothetical protein LQ338_003599 [Usnochroma carphineum]